MNQRHVPRPRDLAPLLQLNRPSLRGRRRRLDAAITVDDLRRAARRRAPKAAFDYADGAADRELALRRARAKFASLTFRPQVLRDVTNVELGTTFLAQQFRLPFGIAPTGFTRMMHSEGEIAGTRAAGRAGIPFCVSTMATTSLEDVARAAPATQRWFQLYMWRDRAKSMALVDRALAAGYNTLVVTVDVPVAGARLRDVRNGLTIPPRLTARTVLNAAPRMGWWFDFLTTEPLAFASLDRWSGTVASLLDTMFDPSMTFDDLTWLRQRWPGQLVVKGVQRVDDARRAVDCGVDAVWLSNHGGRQLDQAVEPLTLVPTVRRELGTDVGVIVDTGVMSGQDVVAALALGADFVMVGRAYLYGLMAGGEPGVDRALEILAKEATRTMRLLGAARLCDLSSEHVSMG